jgi:hypothetical protein
MNNSATGTVTLAPATGGTKTLATTDSDYCKAWRIAAKKWCGEDPKPDKRRFNDYYFDELEKLSPGTVNRAPGSTTGGIDREVPLLIKERPGNKIYNVDDVIANAPGTPLALAAQSAQQVHATQIQVHPSAGGPGMKHENRVGMSAAFDSKLQQQGVDNRLAKPKPKKRKRSDDDEAYNPKKARATGEIWRYSLAFPDGMTGKTAIEIKGPGDRESEGQCQKYADAAPDKECIFISPETCDPDNEITTAGGGCRADAKPKTAKKTAAKQPAAQRKSARLKKK